MGSTHIERHLTFRDFLLSHPATAAQYATVKKGTLASLPLTRQPYQDRKAPFIVAIQAQAIQWYRLQQCP